MNYFKSLVLTLAAFLGIFSLENCKKDCPEQQKYLGTYPLGDIKDYLYFKPGSLWVYECDSTLELDSQVMVSIDTPWLKKSYIQFQHILFQKKSLNEGSTYSTFSPAGDIPYSSNYEYGYSIVVKANNPSKNSYSTDCRFFKPYDPSKLGGGGSAPTSYKGLLTDYKVLGKTYDSVRVFQVQHSGGFPEPNIPTTKMGQVTYYYAKGVGIVRIHVWTSKDGGGKTFKFNWNLKSYNLK